MADMCYSFLRTNMTIGIVHRGETGYYKTDIAECNKIKTVEDGIALVNELNKRLGLTLGEVRALESGSMFGWNTPAADSKNWTDEGELITD